MSDKSFISRYRSITAPDELYGRIMNADIPEDKKNIKVYVKTALSIAAVFVAVIVTAFMLNGRDSMPGVYVEGERLTGEVSITEADNGGIMLARGMNELTCNLELELKEETVISLSEGLLFADNGEILLESGNEASFNGRICTKWIIPRADSTKTYNVRLQDKNGTYFITLSFDSQAQIWSACLTK